MHSTFIYIHRHMFVHIYIYIYTHTRKEQIKKSFHECHAECPGQTELLSLILPLVLFTLEVTHKVFLCWRHFITELSISCNEHVFAQISARFHVAVLPVWPCFQNFEEGFAWTDRFRYLPVSHQDEIWWQLLAFHRYFQKGFSFFQLLFRWFSFIKVPYKN